MNNNVLFRHALSPRYFGLQFCGRRWHHQWLWIFASILFLQFQQLICQQQLVWRWEQPHRLANRKQPKRPKKYSTSTRSRQRPRRPASQLLNPRCWRRRPRGRRAERRRGRCSLSVWPWAWSACSSTMRNIWVIVGWVDPWIFLKRTYNFENYETNYEAKGIGWNILISIFSNVRCREWMSQTVHWRIAYRLLEFRFLRFWD